MATVRARVLAIVPAWNEERSIGAVVRTLCERGDVDVVVIDDGSTDETASIARSSGARVVCLPFNLGIGAAVQAGFQFADQAEYDVAIQVDADGQHLASEIDGLLAGFLDETVDVVVGSRYILESTYRAPRVRRAGMLLFAAVVSIVTGHRIHDTTSGFRAYRKRAIRYLAAHYPEDYPEVEALVLLHRAGFRVHEVPCSFAARAQGRSSITAGRSVYYVIKVLLAIGVGLFRRVPQPES